MFRDSCERGDRLFDLGAGFLENKRRWSTRIVPSTRYTWYPLSPRVQLLRLKHWMTARRPAVAQARSATKG
jgi:hypothetical protein